MANHYHLLIETPKANLSIGMRQLNGIYTQISGTGLGRTAPLLDLTIQGSIEGIVLDA
jgi:putative transposase